MTSSTSGDGGKAVVEFPQPELTPEERARRLRVEVERWARLAPGEWRLYADEVAEKYKVSRADLKAMVEAVIKANEKKAREDKAEDRHQERRAERRAEKDEVQARREAERARRSGPRKKPRRSKKKRTRRSRS
jgi:hypothetical protein